MKNLAIIPARGGSKRIPRKNVKEFLGKPIIAYSIETALKTEIFDEVMVSTDDDEIAEIARKYGASVPFMRSKGTSDDHATTLSVIKEVLATYKIKQEKDFNLICCIYPTAPLIQIKHLKKGLELLESKNYQSVFPVVTFGYPVWRGLERMDDGKTNMLWPENLNARSQDMKKVYHDAGQWYWIKSQKINHSIFSENTATIVLEETEAQDIDNLTDWKLAELKYHLLNEA
ncbi:MAG: pseudaminic acid cytidylyltransferase [Bacteroidales bacterium]|nr:pseudaminic acid cytidylyltransferase [Bacteroidales bacterium]